jgi:hypothetical protein
LGLILKLEFEPKLGQKFEIGHHESIYNQLPIYEVDKQKITFWGIDEHGKISSINDNSYHLS